MTSAWVRSRIAAVLACGALLIGYLSLRFARSVLVEMLERGRSVAAESSQLTVVVLTMTRPAALAAALVLCLAVVVVVEIAGRDGELRLLVHVCVLVLAVVAVAIAVVGLLLPFHVPGPAIP